MGPGEAATSLPKGRLEAFSDGVIAIIITIMVLELHLPETMAEGFSAVELTQIAPKFVAYAMSFLVVAIMWVNHHHITSTAGRVGPGFLWLNLQLLFWMSLIPLVTAFAGEHPGSRYACAAYGFILAATGWSFTWMRHYLAEAETDNVDMRAMHQAIRRRSILGGVIYSVSVPLAFVHPYAAMVCFVIVPVMFLWPRRPPASVAVLDPR